MTAGDDDFSAWVAGSRGRLRSTAYLLSADWHLADDLVQESLARVYSRWAKVSRAGDPGAYARRVLVNLYLDHLRRPSRRERTYEQVPEPRGLPDDATPSGDRELLLNALRRVPPGQRAVLVLRYWDDLSIEQAAEVLGRSTGHVKSQAHRGLATLRAEVASQCDVKEGP